MASLKEHKVLSRVSGRVLDIGCIGKIENIGKPHWLHHRIANRSEECVGIDLNEKGCKLANNLGYSVICKDIQHFAPKKKFDCVTLLELIEHVPNQADLLLNCKKTMNPDGCLLLTTPNAFSINYLLELFFTGRLKGFPVWKTLTKGHVLLHSRYTVAQLAQRVGMEVSWIGYATDKSKSRFNWLAKLISKVRPELSHSLIVELKISK